MGQVMQTRLPRSGIIAALDMTTNKIVWRYRWPDQCYSGTLATGGNLLFVGRSDGRLTALDSRTGNQLWEFQTGAGMHAPMSTFAHDGKQYVLAYSAGNALIGSPRGDSVWLFGLEGSLPPDEPGVPVNRLAAAIPTAGPIPATPRAAVTPAAAAAADAANGRRVYDETCVICHGEDGLGGHGGGAPLDNVPNAAAVIDVVTAGRNAMPSFSDSLTPVDIRDVAAYVAEHLARQSP
jgi:quinohemoprotein ethanol dehydrogenase